MSSDGTILLHALLMMTASCVLFPGLFFAMWTGFRHKVINLHKLWGTVAIVMLIIGVNLAPGYTGAGTPAGESAFAKSHKGLGQGFMLGAFSLSAGGYLTSFVSMPKIRTAHGLFGMVMMLLGPIVAWSGWVSWGTADIGFLNSSPIFWYLPMAGLAAYLVYTRVKALQHSLLDINEIELKAKIDAGELLILVEGFVVNFSTFDHPGGRNALMRHLGKEATAAFHQIGAHSEAARDVMKSLAIGRFRSSDSDAQLLGNSQGEISLLSGATDLVFGLIGKPTKGSVRAKLVEVHSENQTVKRFKFQIDGLNQIGHRMYVKHANVSRPYTAIDVNGSICEFAIRIYPNGKVTPYLNNLTIGQEIEATCGTHADQIPAACKSVLLVAGGTGITPMIAMLKTKPKQCKVELLWWLKDPSDLFLLDELSKANVTFCFNKGGLTEATKNSLKGHEVFIPCEVSIEVLRPKLQDVEEVFVCGPDGFCKRVQEVAVKECKFDKNAFNTIN